MLAAQFSRGPDGIGTYHNPVEHLFLGHLRLAIVDINGGKQPMWSADNTLAVVFNGEIYNHAELRSDLQARGAIFLTDHSDTEVLLHGYRIWGNGFIHRLNGMWSFVIYDKAHRRLFACRDRFGKKPFYYTHRAGFFAFASELTALSAHRSVPQEVSALALRKYFAYGYIPAPHTLYRGVAKLPGGFQLEFDLVSGELRTRRWWRFELDPDDSKPDEPSEEDADRLHEIMSRAVKRRLSADVPVGIFLSGGIDSSTIAALAARSVGIGCLETFSIGFDETSFDESAYALMVASHVGSRHHHRVFSAISALEELPQVLARLDEPMADSSLIPTWHLCKHARKQVTVALGGDGADELFAGYDTFIAQRWAAHLKKLLPRPIHHALLALVARLPVSHRNMSFDFRLKRMLRGIGYAPRLMCPIWMAPLTPQEIGDLVNEPIDPSELYSEAIESWEQGSHRNSMNNLMQFYVDLYLQNDILTKVDRASMAHSLEVRSPFLDIELVDHVRRLPNSWKFSRGRSKVLLKIMASKLLPDKIIRRSKKGFGTPIGAWFQKGILPPPSQPGYGLNESFLNQKISDHMRGKSDERAFLWCAHVLSTHLNKLII